MLSSLKALNMENDLKIIPDYGNQIIHQLKLAGGFKYFLMFNPVWGDDPI